MLSTYTWPEFEYRQSEEQKSGQVERHPVVIIGAGVVGLTAALDCASRGIPVVVLDDNNTVSVGSRAVCYAKRPLEIWDRLGWVEKIVNKQMEDGQFMNADITFKELQVIKKVLKKK